MRDAPLVITVCGAGEQAETHVQGSLQCYEPTEIRIWARRYEVDHALAAHFIDDRLGMIEDLADATAGAHVITTATSSWTAFLSGSALVPAQHINLGAASLTDSREVDDAAVARLSMFTDSL